MIKLFEVRETGIFPTEHCYTNTYLKGIIEEYGDNAGKVFAFMHYMKSANPTENPYFNVPDLQKREVIQHSVCPELDLDNDLVDYCLEIVEKLYETTFSRMYKASKRIMDELSYELSFVKLSIDAHDGNSGELLKAYKLYNDLKAGYKDAYNDMMAEMGIDKTFANLETNKYSDAQDELE